jgi:hypothetical protein
VRKFRLSPEIETCADVADPLVVSLRKTATLPHRLKDVSPAA